MKIDLRSGRVQDCQQTECAILSKSSDDLRRKRPLSEESGLSLYDDYN